MNKQIETLLNKKMDRRDFIKHVGVGTLAVFGLGSVVKLMSSVNSNPVATSSQAQNTSMAYGASVYGGRKS